MKRIIVVAVALSVIILACGKKIMPDGSTGKRTESGEKQKNNREGKTSEADANNMAPPEDRASAADQTNKDKTDNTGNTGSKPAELPTGPNAPNKPSEEEMGKTLYSSKCTKCHGSKNVKNYTLGQWESIMKTMGPNAKLTGEEEAYLAAYIKANAKK